MSKLITGFICVGNSCRSQMAEGFAKEYGSDILEVYSAGTEPAEEVNPHAVLVMEEIGIDISNQKPKLLKEIPSKLDLLITMGCGVECPFLPCEFREDWGLDDPARGSVKEFRETRDIIKEKVKDLIKKINEGEIP